MTPTLDELIEYARMEAEYWSGLRESKLTAFAIGTLTALQRLREVEATVKYSFTVQPPTEDSSATEPPVKDSLTTAPSIAPPDDDVQTIGVVVRQLPSSFTGTPNEVTFSLEVVNGGTFKAGDVCSVSVTVPRHTPRPGVPTVEEVGDEEKCWLGCEYTRVWEYCTGLQARNVVDGAIYYNWLPADAIPMPEFFE